MRAATSLRSAYYAEGNTAVGWSALTNNYDGSYNVAVGHEAIYSGSGGANVAVGFQAMRNSTSAANTVIGYRAARDATGGAHVAVGDRAGLQWTTGNYNIAIGNQGASGDSYTTRIGASQTRAFIAGVRGVTTGIADAVPVLVDSAGQLGTISSSRRFKEDIRDMGDATERLLDLRAVLFRYKGREGPDEYGLIAEEVAEIFPELVVYDDEGLPETVKYHLLAPMLLNELQRTTDRLEDVGAGPRRAGSAQARAEGAARAARGPGSTGRRLGHRHPLGALARRPEAERSRPRTRARGAPRRAAG